MKVVLCVKGVMQSYTSGVLELQLNPFDLACLQYLLERKQKYNLQITCLCMGSKTAENMLRYCLAMGADQALLVSDSFFAGSDTFATTYILSEAIKKTDFDMIVCGHQSIDGETGQVPYGLAKRLGISSISNVNEMDVLNENRVRVKRKNDHYEEEVVCRLPVLLSFEEFSVSSPVVSLLRLKQTKKASIETYDCKSLNLDAKLCGLNGSLTKVLDIDKKIIPKERRVFEGTNDEIATFLINEISGNTK